MPKKRRNRARIYYGTNKTKLYWTVKVTDAKAPVRLDGSLMDALKGTPGQTIGCHLSNCVLSNQSVFPHPVHFAAFTRCTALVVDKIANGVPTHAVRYRHGYSDLVDLNDTDPKKKAIKQRPELAERSFSLTVPQVEKRVGRPAGSAPAKPSGKQMPTMPRGALDRARRAGLVTADLAQALR